MKNRKKFLIIASILVIVSVSIFIGAKAVVNATGNYTDDDFVDNKIMVLFTHDYTFTLDEENHLHIYAPEDFPEEIGCIKVNDIQIRLIEELNGYIDELEYVDRDNIYNQLCEAVEKDGKSKRYKLDKLQRFFCLTLSEHSKENVLKAIDYLNSLDYVWVAEPNWIFYSPKDFPATK